MTTERSHGKARPTLPRASDLRPAETAGKRTVNHDPTGRFTAGNTGLLEFNINPIDPQTDYDWAVWDVTTEPDSCTAKGSAIAPFIYTVF